MQGFQFTSPEAQSPLGGSFLLPFAFFRIYK